MFNCTILRNDPVIDSLTNTSKSFESIIWMITIANGAVVPQSQTFKKDGFIAVNI